MRPSSVERALGIGDDPADEFTGRDESRRSPPTPWPAGKNSRSTSTSRAVGGAEVVGPGGHRGEHLGGERLELLGVLVEVLGPLVAQDPARLAGVRAGHDGAVLGTGEQGVLVAGDRREPQGWR